MSGLTVMISLAGLFLTGIDVFSGVAIGTILVVGVAVLGSLTFLPALLSLLGKATDRGRIPFLGRRRAAAKPSRLWGLVVRAVARRPLALGGLAAVALLALATPLLSLHLENPDLHAFPNTVPVIRTAGGHRAGLPRRPGAGRGGRDRRRPQRSGGQPRHHRPARPGRGAPTARSGSRSPPRCSGQASLRSDQVLVISVPLSGDGTNATSVNALNTLDNRVLPATLGKVPGISYAVGGDTASNTDFDAQLDSRTPLVFAFVLGLAFLLLMFSFRSLAIPALSIGLNLLSVGAAYGIMTWIFQDGHLQGLLGFTAYGGITPWMPLFMFVLLFGLSMDYHVFILSRIRELRLRGASARAAVTDGITSSAGVVTSAAVIMVAVFSIFATLSEIEFKVFGVAMAVAVLIDATVVRGVLLPAGLTLLGDRAWSLPGRRRSRRQARPSEVEPRSVQETLNLTLGGSGRDRR